MLPTSRITFSPYPNDVKVLEQAVKDKLFVNVQTLIREIVGNWCADQRRDVRLNKMPAHHYSMRNADEYSDSE